MTFGRITARTPAVRSYLRKQAYKAGMAARFHRKKKKVEYKQYTQGANAQPFYIGDAGKYLTCLCQVSQGTADTQRIGDRINLTGLHIRLNIQSGIPDNTGASNPFSNVRVIIFQYKDKDMNPVSAEMFLTGAALGSYNPYSARNIDYLDKYVFLYDKVHTVRGWVGAPAVAFTGALTNATHNRFLKIRVPLKFVDKQLRYQAAGTNGNNLLWMYIVSDSVDRGSATKNTNLSYDSNMAFTDS